MGKTEIIATIIQEGTKLLAHLYRSRPIEIETAVKSVRVEKEESGDELQSKASATDTGCVPCAIGHFSTCSGLINEAMRFARDDGVESNEVIDRVGMCLEELNSMERVDLRSELIVNLPEWEKELANEALAASRKTRHFLESLRSVKELETVAAATQSVHRYIWREYVKRRLQNQSPEERDRFTTQAVDKVIQKLEEEEEDE